MEVVATKPFKTSSNISEIVSKFAKVCKLRSIGVFASENNASLVDDSRDSTEETGFDGEKVHPQPTELLRENSGETEIEKLFDIVSALKSSYIRLQEAHIPYNPKMIIAANKLVVAELEALCKIKRAYKEKQFRKSESDLSHIALLQAKIEVNEGFVEELKFQVKAKNSEIKQLAQELKEVDVGNAKLAEKIKQMSVERKFAVVYNVNTFQKAFAAASKSIHDFAKPLISLMKASGWNLDLAAKSIGEEAVYSKRSHKKYAFEAYIGRRMFSGMALEGHNVDDVMRFDDPIDALINDPDSEFSRFCGKKYLLVVHPKMEASFFGSLDYRTFVLSGKHPRTPFYQIFVKMAKWVWVLQGIAGSLDPKAKAFAVNRGSKFSDVYMESMVEDKEGAAHFVQAESKCRVEFMVIPGFKIGETLLKSRVYLSKVESPLGKC
ncbi:protein GRAVITROPIC IN THE LIGHT 1 [Humulus lupulus]|uniref:protein GRAVITROPIC IN THE LIGHT 1 n=1 Tax=Humulus lupulus TaxID=3486 RepID=UPI002B418240|nr:protein GRAVITROPIC IN THE LIGHT 1 [Humulus lupulus]XP_062081589.1 protein GRAVITROPIC IN THE LIGHT 1 [Humulus lupulus]